MYNKKSGMDFPSFELVMKWTNLKAHLAGAGKGGTCYEDFTPFSVKEIRQHVGLYIFYGLSPSPRIEQKFKPQRQDPLHGKDFIFNAFRSSLERRHKNFKYFFALHSPTTQSPERKNIQTGRFVLS